MKRCNYSEASVWSHHHRRLLFLLQQDYPWLHLEALAFNSSLSLPFPHPSAHITSPNPFSQIAQERSICMCAPVYRLQRCRRNQKPDLGGESYALYTKGMKGWVVPFCLYPLPLVPVGPFRLTSNAWKQRFTSLLWEENTALRGERNLTLLSMSGALPCPSSRCSTASL